MGGRESPRCCQRDGYNEPFTLVRTRTANQPVPELERCALCVERWTLFSLYLVLCSLFVEHCAFLFPKQRACPRLSICIVHFAPRCFHAGVTLCPGFQCLRSFAPAAPVRGLNHRKTANRMKSVSLVSRTAWCLMIGAFEHFSPEKHPPRSHPRAGSSRRDQSLLANASDAP